MSDKKLKIWHVPQIPMKSFEVDVSDPEEAIKILRVLADYDAFQFKNNIKPDFCNAQGLVEWCDGEWVEWYSQDGDSIEQYEVEILEKETPTNSEKVAVAKKLLDSMIADYDYLDKKMGRKSWKSVADILRSQARSLRELLDNKGPLVKEIYQKLRER